MEPMKTITLDGVTYEIIDDKARQHKAGTTLVFDALRCPGIATGTADFYATIVLDRPIDPGATYTLEYTGMYVRGAGTQISSPTTIELDPDNGGHALTLHIAKASAFTQYETYVAVFTGATITITAS